MIREVEVLKLDIIIIMKSVVVIIKGLKVFKIVWNIVGFVRVGYRGVGVVGMVVGRVIGKVSGVFVIVGIGLDIW